MRTETLWQGERRAARMLWWLEVLERPMVTGSEAIFDEVLSLRFRHGPEAEPAGTGRRRGMEGAARSSRDALAGAVG